MHGTNNSIPLRPTPEHFIRNWLLVQHYRFSVRYRLPKRFVLFFPLGIERVLSLVKVLD